MNKHLGEKYPSAVGKRLSLKDYKADYFDILMRCKYKHNYLRPLFPWLLIIVPDRSEMRAGEGLQN